jgi:exodeoxyribonuclease VII small subunit
MTTSASNNAPDPLPPFEQSLAELQKIVIDLENGELNLEQSLERFELGIRLLKSCCEVLDRAEQRIELLTGFDAAGEPLTTPISADVSTGKAEGSGRRSTAKRSSKSMFSDPE